MTEDDVLDTAKALYAMAHGEHIGGKTQAVARMQIVLQQMVDAERLTSNPAKVSGYTAQPDAKVALVNEFKADEERLLRKLDALLEFPGVHNVPTDGDPVKRYDARWIAIARTHFQEGFMALNRAVFQPTRIKLPEDGE